MGRPGQPKYHISVPESAVLEGREFPNNANNRKGSTQIDALHFQGLDVQASVAQCDGHELFRESGNAQAVVVLIRECTGLSCHLPMPGELASSLRGQRSLEDAGGH